MGFVPAPPIPGWTRRSPPPADVAVTYLIVRHGEAEGNQDHRFIGQTDVPLSPLGLMQAQVVSERLAAMPVTAIIASDLQRAFGTVEPASRRLGIPIRHDRDLREISNGDWNLLLPTEVAERWPEEWARYRSGVDVARPGGERWAEVQARAISAIEQDADGRDDGDVVVVGTHGGPTLGLALWAAGVTLEGGLFSGPFAPVSNASITTIELPGPRLVGFNDVGHLGDLARRTFPPFGEAD